MTKICDAFAETDHHKYVYRKYHRKKIVPS